MFCFFFLLLSFSLLSYSCVLVPLPAPLWLDVCCSLLLCPHVYLAEGKNRKPLPARSPSASRVEG